MRIKKYFIPLILPVGFLLLFLFGEVFGGEISGISHLLQLIPLLALIYLAIKKPKIAGPILILAGISLSIFYYLQTQFMFFPVYFILFFPLILSGYLMVKEDKTKSRSK